MEQLGRRAWRACIFSTACLAATALAGFADTPLASGWLAKIAEGACSATLALPFDLPTVSRSLPVVAEEAAGGYTPSGTLEQVIDGARADLLLVPARIANEGQSIGLFAIDVAAASGLKVTSLDTLDATRPIARVMFDEARMSRDALLACGTAAQLLERTACFAALALAAEQLGGAQQCLDLTLDYTSQRVQFGRAIASFQAVNTAARR